MAESARHAWYTAYKEALDYDSWGQVEEAVECYHRLQVATALESTENQLGLSGPRRAAIAQAAAVLKLRMQELNGRDAHKIGIAGMQALKPFMQGLIVSDVRLPEAVAAALKAAAPDPKSGMAGVGSSASTVLQQQPWQQQQAQGDQQDLFSEATASQQERTELGPSSRQQQPQQQQGSTQGTLRPPLSDLQPGDVTLSIACGTPGSWSVKDAESMVRPHVVLTVRDKRGKLLEAVQESPEVSPSRSGASDKLDLDFVYHLQTPLNCLPEDAAVFLELCHWKASKKKMSVKCYSLLSYEDMLRPGAAMLGLYRKPADFKRRGQHPAYTSKPMYVHIIRNLNKH